MSTRSAPSNWLLGKPISSFSAARLPRGLDVLRVVQFHHLEEGETLPVSYKLTCEAVLNIWQRARIPTQRIDSCVRKLSKLYERYLALKKHRTRQGETDTMREDMLRSDLEELFDVATKNASSKMKNDEDKVFLQKQREDVFSSSMSGVDLETTTKENRKRQREEKEENFKNKYVANANKDIPERSPQLSSSSSKTSENEDDFKPSTASSSAPSTSKLCKNIFNSPEVVGALDRVNLTDRGVVFVAGAIVKALGHDVSDVTLSRSSIRRSRRVGRQKATCDQEIPQAEGPLLLHWDGKLLPDIDGSKKKVDRIAILVTGNNHEKLLGIPKVDRGTGKAQAQACIEAATKWKVESFIKGLVFDTTASNTGLHTGACIEIEKILERELVWIACRHHVMELILSAVFSCLFGATGGPETQLFNRFQKKWSTIDKTDYSAADYCLFQDAPFNSLRPELLVYLPSALINQQPRDDYKEFLSLSLLFLGGGNGTETFRAPGPTHHARWMAKAVYALKIYLFRNQFHLTAREAKNIEQLALFVSVIYVKYWNEAPLGIRAPFNDIQLLGILKTYPNKMISEKAYTTFARHLWSLSEHLIALAFFDDRVSKETKEKMVKNLKRPKTTNFLRRINVTKESDLSMENFVTERTFSFFDAVMIDGKSKSEEFLKIPPEKWQCDPVFSELREKCRKMRVVNDTAERGISLIQKYNQSLTKDEEQLQYILRLVANHRKQFPDASKASLTS